MFFVKIQQPGLPGGDHTDFDPTVNNLSY